MSRVDLSERLDPQMLAAVEKQVELVPPSGPLRDQPIERVRAHYKQDRAFWNADRPELPKVENASLPGPFGPIPLRLYYPGGEALYPALVYLHGGGWIVGDLDTHDKIMRLLALKAGVAVVGVDYRLAPEHKFPSQLEECLTVLRHLAAEGGNWNIDGARLAVGGDSAGANMSAALCQILAGEGASPLKAAVLYYGAFGLRDSVSRRKYGGEEDGMSADDLAYYVDCLVRQPEDLRDPRFDVLSGDLTALPPSFIAAAEFDPIVDDSLVLADLLAEAGLEHRLRLYPGVLHGFLHLTRMVEVAGTAIDESALWLREKLKP
ncbi:MAG: alpha/beta hydrolase fold domain-containing protein [Kiloniellales bacterium]|nr:alpha/beta hydrolase fold domain-containing protein [Kiloniellales bacterium]